MNKFTFAVKNKNGYPLKLVICEDTKQYERGQCCVNTTYCNAFILKKELEELEKHLIASGYTRTDKVFGE